MPQGLAALRPGAQSARTKPVPPATPLLAPHPQESLTKLLLFNNLDRGAQRKVVREMYERPIAAGEILIQEGDTGAAQMAAPACSVGAAVGQTLLLPWLLPAKHRCRRRCCGRYRCPCRCCRLLLHGCNAATAAAAPQA